MMLISESEFQTIVTWVTDALTFAFPVPVFILLALFVFIIAQTWGLEMLKNKLYETRLTLPTAARATIERSMLYIIDANLTQPPVVDLMPTNRLQSLGERQLPTEAVEKYSRRRRSRSASRQRRKRDPTASASGADILPSARPIVSIVTAPHQLPGRTVEAGVAFFVSPTRAFTARRNLAAADVNGRLHCRVAHSPNTEVAFDVIAQGDAEEIGWAVLQASPCCC